MHFRLFSVLSLFLFASLVAAVNLPSIPEECASECNTVTGTISNCTTLSCLCRPDVASSLESCVNCGIRIAGSTITPDLLQQAQTSLNQYSEGCTSASMPIGNLTVNGAPASGKNSNSNLGASVNEPATNSASIVNRASIGMLTTFGIAGAAAVAFI